MPPDAATGIMASPDRCGDRFDALLDAEQRYRAAPGPETRRDLVAVHGDWIDWFLPEDQEPARHRMIADFLAHLADADASPPPVPLTHAWPLRDPHQVGRDPRRPSTRLAAALKPSAHLCIFEPGAHSREPYELAIYEPGITIEPCNLPRFVDALDLPRAYTLDEAEAAFGPWAERRVLQARSWPGRPMPGRSLSPGQAAAWLQTEIGRAVKRNRA